MFVHTSPGICEVLAPVQVKSVFTSVGNSKLCLEVMNPGSKWILYLKHY